ncbi:MAG: dissimilatory-type sulfite reductase subunit alpha [Nitrospirae bacterium CG_4_9_14_3_um_filter_53_35]|nr:MAG: sulfite reductase, dissimilatory-type subunit alpha [Nitrospirae bacterium CG2_30_53_67]PIS35949.1 MAG: dissimilatory-type sulfite reductase subunit alpha [Nitrospirae bacterium CG08_land_8_20_14_0_20_52_24]PIV82561.1 MAG: dissimilatory-type sulfite reductase subunit alpha [Nitrospirae bacterium CG17_big_fil_post_rev_8_21_14_2_50_50_9]PIW85595.1 MAG: dissimilatory-type sulfite reductase subunit alpha [Nitrospirae bacterium CG_4_8_14_3_um_filter_50_41]PJA75818.1 MAG: dissimilatory-type s
MSGPKEPDEIKTPMLDELEKGPWPSFVKDLKQLSRKKPAIKQLLGQLEQSYETCTDYWQGTVINLDGYGGGVIGRYSELTEKFPEMARFNTIRILEPSGWVYSTEALRELCDISEKHSAGILQFHGMTGDILMLGSNNEQTFEAGEALMEKGWDIGGSGAALRTLACCVGPGRCEMSCFDTLGLTKYITDTFISELHRPEFPYKYKFKISGCANDCACSMQRSDMPIIGTWRDEIQVNQEEAAKFIDQRGEQFVIKNVITRCPTQCMTLKDRTIKIDDKNCVHCMHCINVMHKALAIGKDRGVTILIGGKRSLKIGDTMSSVLVPFMKMETEEDREKLTDLVRRIWDFWGENGMEHERVGEFIDRVGLGAFLDGIGLLPDPQMVRAPRSNPYIKFEEYTRPRMAGEEKKVPPFVDKELEGEETTS